MAQTRRRFPEYFKRKAAAQVLAGMPLCHVAETLGIAESLVGRWKRQYEQLAATPLRIISSISISQTHGHRSTRYIQGTCLTRSLRRRSMRPQQSGLDTAYLKIATLRR